MEDCEKIQFDYVSQMAGEYVEEMGRTDFATWSKDEWMEFLHVVVKAHHEAPPF